jgi:hypothetical protein
MPPRKRNASAFSSGQESTPQAVDAGIFGGRLDNLDAQRRVARAIPIAEIDPDPRQPRRIIPLEIRAQTTDPQAALQLWIALIEKETERPFPLQAFLEVADFERPEKPDESEAELIALVSLARTIKEEGRLPDPISVYRTGDRWRIEYGERRWLAHHLLYAYTGDDQWSKILAFSVEQFNPWRQAAENGAHQNLNAVGKARQLALLIMALYEAQGYTFEAYDSMVKPNQSDRCFYAQVADGERYRIPRGQSEQIMAYMGLKDASYLRHYRTILDASDELWVSADELNMTEGAIRTAMKAKRNPDSVTNVTVSIKVPPGLAPKWQAAKAGLPGVKDADLLEVLLNFYLSHQEEE